MKAPLAGMPRPGRVVAALFVVLAPWLTLAARAHAADTGAPAQVPNLVAQRLDAVQRQLRPLSVTPNATKPADAVRPGAATGIAGHARTYPRAANSGGDGAPLKVVVSAVVPELRQQQTVAAAPAPPGLTVPALQGRSFDEARQVTMAIGLQLNAIGSVAPPGLVETQEPSAGIVVKAGSIVDVALRREPEPDVIVPDYRGKSLVEARQLSMAAGLDWRFHGVRLDARSVVATQKPSAGTLVPQGTAVELTLALEAGWPAWAWWTFVCALSLAAGALLWKRPWRPRVVAEVRIGRPVTFSISSGDQNHELARSVRLAVIIKPGPSRVTWHDRTETKGKNVVRGHNEQRQHH